MILYQFFMIEKYFLANLSFDSAKRASVFIHKGINRHATL